VAFYGTGKPVPFVGSCFSRKRGWSRVGFPGKGAWSRVALAGKVLVEAGLCNAGGQCCVPQGLKPSSTWLFTARVKPVPFVGSCFSRKMGWSGVGFPGKRAGLELLFQEKGLVEAGFCNAGGQSSVPPGL
jgi:hypothetical protein